MIVGPCVCHFGSRLYSKKWVEGEGEHFVGVGVSPGETALSGTLSVMILYSVPLLVAHRRKSAGGRGPPGHGRLQAGHEEGVPQTPPALKHGYFLSRRPLKK